MQTQVYSSGVPRPNNYTPRRTRHLRKGPARKDPPPLNPHSKSAQGSARPRELHTPVAAARGRRLQRGEWHAAHLRATRQCSHREPAWRNAPRRAPRRNGLSQNGYGCWFCLRYGHDANRYRNRALYALKDTQEDNHNHE